MTKISILSPVYNVKDFIVRCLESVAAQTYSGPLECIIVDDCGTDGSIAYAEAFIKHYIGPIDFRIVHHEHNRGLAAARNTALDAATGDFVFHLDSDDWLEPKAIELLVKKQQEMDADIVSGSAINHENKRKLLWKEPDYSSPLEMARKTLDMTLDHVIWRRLIRKSLYTDNGIRAVEGVNIGEDHHTLPRLAYYAKKIARIDDVVYNYNCMNPTSYMGTKSASFNMKRYKSDLASICILQEFFADKDQESCDFLNGLKDRFFLSRKFQACSFKDREAYKQVVTDGCLPDTYLKDYLHVRLAYCKTVAYIILHRYILRQKTNTPPKSVANTVKIIDSK